METYEQPLRRRGTVRNGILVALVAIFSFGAGIGIGTSGPAPAIVTHIPFIGDGLDATPDVSVDFTDFWKAWNVLEARYVDTNRSTALPTARERLEGAIQGLADSYNDPYTVYLLPSEAKIFMENISGSFAGVGMEIGIRNEQLTVIAPLKGTPAESAGIKTGDIIASIDGMPTDGVSVQRAVSKIRGPEGTTVKFTLIRDNRPIILKVVRAIIHVPQIEDGLDAESGVYRIALYEFTSNSANLFSRALQRFRESGSNLLIIDIRSNPGGYLDAAVDIASHLIPRGRVVVSEDFGEDGRKYAHVSLGYNSVPNNTKIVVLIDGGTASASEILAGALKDHNLATVIGTTSFGKGSVQTLVPFGGGALKITIAEWVTPSGHRIMDNGITPDIVVEYTKAKQEGEYDSQMERAIQFLITGK